MKDIVRESVDHASDRYGGISYGDTLDAVDGAQDVFDHAEEFESSHPRATMTTFIRATAANGLRACDCA